MDSFFIKILGPLAIITFIVMAILYKTSERARVVIDLIGKVFCIFLVIAFIIGILIASYYDFAVAISFIIVTWVFFGMNDH